MQRIIQLVPYSLSDSSNGGVLRSTNILSAFSGYEIIRVVYSQFDLRVKDKIFPITLSAKLFFKLFLKLRNPCKKINIVDLLTYIYFRKFKFRDNDIIILETLDYVNCIEYVSKFNILIVYNSHNFAINYTHLNGGTGNETDGVLRTISLLDNYLVICCSEREKSLYLNYFQHSKIFVVPNGAERSEVSINNRFKSSINFYFIGDLTTKANKEAVGFIDEFWRDFEIQYPITIIGRGVRPVKIGKLTYTGELTNDQRKEFFLQSSILLVPIFSGEGTRLKILEAFANGNPVISTPKGIEGLNFDENDYLSFRNKTELLDIIRNIGEVRKMNNGNALKKMNEEYFWDIISDKFRILITEKYSRK